MERTLYSTITSPNKRSKSLFPRRRPPLLLKESECRSISGIIGSRFVAAPKNNLMTSPPLGRCYLFSTFRWIRVMRARRTRLPPFFQRMDLGTRSLGSGNRKTLDNIVSFAAVISVVTLRAVGRIVA